jgi:hypothetical protein
MIGKEELRMDRLTKKWGDKTFLPDIPLPDPHMMKSQSDLDVWHKNRREIEDQIIRLSQYEDSGLSPEEICELAKAKAEGRIVMLPVPIGGAIYIPYKFRDLDGTVDAGIEETKLSGYIKEGDREFYTTHDEVGASDYEPGLVFLTRQEAEKALETLAVEEGTQWQE